MLSFLVPLLYFHSDFCSQAWDLFYLLYSVLLELSTILSTGVACPWFCFSFSSASSSVLPFPCPGSHHHISCHRSFVLLFVRDDWLQGKTASWPTDVQYRMGVLNIIYKNVFNLRFGNQQHLGSLSMQYTPFTSGLICDKFQLAQLLNRMMSEWGMFRAVAFKFQTHTFYRQTDSLWLKHWHWKARKWPQHDSLQAKFQLKDLNVGNCRKNWRQDSANISLSLLKSVIILALAISAYAGLQICKTSYIPQEREVWGFSLHREFIVHAPQKNQRN